MEVFGVGPLELFFILIIALIFLGPRDMVKAGRSLGKLMRQIVMSPTWRTVQQTSRELRTLPNRLIREAGMEDDLKDLNQLSKEVGSQINSLRKPFKTAADEANLELQETQTILKPPAEPPASGGLGAWTTAPTNPEPAVEAAGGSDHEAAIDAPAEQASNGSNTSSDPASDTTENPNPDES
jgi:sec-independent protein translocase protein TatB